MARIQYTAYTFNRPLLINKHQYDDLKRIISHTPNYQFPQAPSVLQHFKFEIKFGLIWLLVSGVFLILGYLWYVFLWISIAGFFILGMAMITSGLMTVASYQRYLWQYNRYYRTLKNNIKKSNDYHHFKQMMF